MLLTLYYMAATWIQTWRIQSACNDLSRYVAQRSSIAFFYAATGSPRKQPNVALLAVADASSSSSAAAAAAATTTTPTANGVDESTANVVDAADSVIIADEDIAGKLVKTVVW